MRKIEPGDPETRSLDLVAENLERMRDLFPQAFTEDGIDFDTLRQLLGDAVNEGDERYGMIWSGKRRARRLALTPSRGTLRPCPEESVDWDTTQNLMIEGDNLETLKLLQRSFRHKVKVIYIDPPYNTGRNLIYPNDYRDGIKMYLKITGQIDGGDKKLTSNPENGGRFHTNWLSMMYPRLILAKNLLRPDGVLTVTIDENEQSTLGTVLNEIFEEDTYDHVCVPIVHNPRGVQGMNFSYIHEYAFFVFRRDMKVISDREIEGNEIKWSQFRNWGAESRREDAQNCFYPVLVKDGVISGFGDVCPDDFHPKQTEFDGDVAYVYPIDRSGVERKWRYARQSAESVRHLLRARKGNDKGKDKYEIEIGKDFALHKTVWTDKRYDANEYGTRVVRELVPNAQFTFPKSLWAVYDCLLAAAREDPDAIIMDFFAGSGTTGHALMELNKNMGGNRRFILVQLPEPTGNATYPTIFDVMKARIEKAGRRIKEEFRGGLQGEYRVDGNSSLKVAADNAASGRRIIWDATGEDITDRVLDFAEQQGVKGEPLVDTGFRVFKLDTSNIRAWEPDRENLKQSILESQKPIKPDRSEEDILYEVMLKLGKDLRAPIETRIVVEKRVVAVDGGALIACMSEEIGVDDSERVALEIAEWLETLENTDDVTAVFRDDAFINDVAKLNLAEILRQRGVKDVRSI